MSSDRRDKALSVFLSTIMVLSVVAMGGVALSGSVAADPGASISGYDEVAPEPADGDLAVTADGEVPDDFAELFDSVDVYGSIPKATDAAGENIRIIVFPGDYSINPAEDSGDDGLAAVSAAVSIDETGVELVSFAGPEETNLSVTGGGNTQSTIFHIDADDVTLQGFNISEDWIEAGIVVDGDNAIVEHNLIKDPGTNINLLGYGVSVGDGSGANDATNATVANNEIQLVENKGDTGVTGADWVAGIGVLSNTGSHQFENNVIEGNDDLQDDNDQYGIRVGTDVGNFNNINAVSNTEIHSNTISNVKFGIATNDGNDAASDTLNITNNSLSVKSDSGATGIDVVNEVGDGNVDLSNNTIQSDDNTVGTGIALSSVNNAVNADVEDVSIDNVTNGISAGSFSGDFLNITNVTITNVGSVGIVADDTNLGVADFDDIEVQGDGSGTTGVDASGGGADELRVQNSVLNATDTGVDLSSDIDIGTVVVSNTEIDNANSQAVHVVPGGDGNTISITESTSIDQSAGHGIHIDLSSSTGADTVEVDNVEINGTTNNAVHVADIDNTDDTVNVTNSVLTSNGAGVNIALISVADPEVYVHFNEIVENTAGASVTGDSLTGTLSFTFNDFVDNENNALDTSGGVNSGVVNANYSWWGSDAGPNSAGGDSVSLSSSDDATTEPFLLESAVENYDDTNLGGTNVLRFGHNVEVTNNKGSLAFPAVANRTAGEAIEGNTTDVMIYKLVDGQFVDAGDQVPQTMEGHVVDLTEATNDSAFVTITYSDDVADSAGGYTYEQGANLVGAPIQGPAGDDAVFNLNDDYVISPYLSNTENSLEGSYSGTSSIADDDDASPGLSQGSDDVSPFSAYVIEVPSNETRFKGGNIPGGTDASEIDALLLGN